MNNLNRYLLIIAFIFLISFGITFCFAMFNLKLTGLQTQRYAGISLILLVISLVCFRISTFRANRTYKKNKEEKELIESIGK